MRATEAAPGLELVLELDPSRVSATGKDSFVQWRVYQVRAFVALDVVARWEGTDAASEYHVSVQTRAVLWPWDSSLGTPLATPAGRASKVPPGYHGRVATAIVSLHSSPVLPVVVVLIRPLR